MLSDAGVLATLFLITGLILLGLEFFIPSFGMILVLAIISLIVSFWSACKAWWGDSPVFFWTYVFVLVAGAPAIMIGAVGLMQKTRLGARVILNPTPPSSAGTTNPLEELIGCRGVSQTVMTPGGMILLGKERYHAESIGMPIEPGTDVVVVSARVNRLVVRPVSREDDQSEEAGDEDVFGNAMKS
ncbi:MAG: NfeD family protein [Planctomycetota bacterium]